ncbi:chromosomal replication initiator protein DnaA [Vulgatibacter sp.]|uniref:chromosomal replication initiator protein DnaA n=1 Tax=Vulgatibacter sp. TaxID=1971226 RepID=UPI0035644FC9
MSGAAPSFWSEAVERLRNSTPDYVYKNWLSQLTYVGHDESRLTIGVPSLFARDWILDHYGDVLRKHVHAATTVAVEIDFVIDPSAAGAGGLAPGARESGSSDAGIDDAELGEVDPNQLRRPLLSERFTFENFVVGPSNQLAAAAASAVADRPGRIYNPLFIYGGTGLGKTHLLHAIGNRILAREPNLRVVYTSAERFLNEFVVLLRKGRMEDFRKKYREEVDVLMMDDIQVLKKAQETQNEFFYTFNDLQNAGKAIILTSDIHPNELPNIESRLRTRFTSGLTADIYEPPFEVRVAILKRKAELENLQLPDDVAQFVCSAISRSVRDLEGALTRLTAHSHLTGRPLTVPYAEEVLRDMLPAKQALSIPDVQKTVAAYYGVEVSELCGEKRMRPIARSRAVAMYFCRKLISDASFPVIGAAFGGKHHTTVMSAVERIATERDKTPNFARELEEIEQRITR